MMIFSSELAEVEMVEVGRKKIFSVTSNPADFSNHHFTRENSCDIRYFSPSSYFV